MSCISISVLLPFSSQKVFIIPTSSGFVIYQFRVIPPVLALLCKNCPLTFKLNHILPFSKGCHHWRCSVERDILVGFASFARGRRWCCGLFLIKLRAWGLAVLLRGDFSMGVFPVWFVKLLRAPFLMSIWQWQLLIL